MNRGKVVIIGAGPAGLAAAHRLACSGLEVRVLDASSSLGGLSASLQLWGQTVDLGPHRFFSSNRMVTEFWHEILDGRYSLVNRLTRIHYRGKFFHYPLQPLNALCNLGPADVLNCILSYGAEKFRHRRAESFEEWVVARFGRRLFEIFFRSYTEKVWGIPCARIDADWAAQRIRKLSLSEAVKSAFFRGASRRHKTLADQFLHPHGGSGALYHRMADQIRQKGGVIELDAPVARVLTRRNAAGVEAVGVELEDGRVVAADHVISTMPVTELVKNLRETPDAVRQACDLLYYRNSILVYLELDRKDLFPDNWLYVHSPEVLHGRIANFRNWCPSLTQGRDTTILCIEYWCFDSDPIWSSSQQSLGALAERELRRLDLIAEDVSCLNAHVVKLPRSYPVYETGYRAHLRQIQDFLQGISNLHAIGRNGAFKYNNQDHSILMGLLTAKEIVTGEPQGVWSINSDSDYQEGAPIGAAARLTVKTARQGGGHAA